MSQLLIIIIFFFLFLIANAVFFYFLYKKTSQKAEDSKNDGGLLFIQNQLNELTNTLDKRMGESSRLMNESVRSQFSESQQLIKEITKELSQVKETSKQVVGFADQLQNLQDILKNPKQRGILGEYYLETVLKNVLPPERFQMQYKFSDGEIVDAVVFLDRNKFLPIDSKFSLENYNRILGENNPIEKEKLEKIFKQDLKNRIDETAKYIRPEEGTMDFAFMFIPSEGIYYDLLINQVGAVKTSTIDLIEYAFQKKKVIIVSPTSFLAYLQTVLQGLRSLQIEEKATEIIKRVGELDKHIANYGQFMEKMGSSLGTTVNHYNTASKEFKKIDKDVFRIAGESSGIELPLLDKPETE